MNKKRILAGTLATAMTLAMFTGCSNKNKSDGGTVELSWYLSGVKQDSTFDDVWNKANEILEERYGIKLNFILTDGTNYSQKIQMMNAAGESYDLAFTSNWTNNYYTNVENGSLYDLTELLPKKAPKLWASLSDAEKTAVTIDGKIYASPNWQVQARAMGVNAPKQMLDKTSYTIDDINTVEDWEGYIAELVSKNPEFNHPTGTHWNIMAANYGLVAVTQEGLPGSVYYNKEGKPEIVNQFATPEFMEFAKWARGLTEKGLRPNVKTTKNYGKKDDLKTPGQLCNWKPGLHFDLTRNSGYKRGRVVQYF